VAPGRERAIGDAGVAGIAEDRAHCRLGVEELRRELGGVVGGAAIKEAAADRAQAAGAAGGGVEVTPGGLAHGLLVVEEMHEALLALDDLAGLGAGPREL